MEKHLASLRKVAHHIKVELHNSIEHDDYQTARRLLSALEGLRKATYEVERLLGRYDDNMLNTKKVVS